MALIRRGRQRLSTKVKIVLMLFNNVMMRTGTVETNTTTLPWSRKVAECRDRLLRRGNWVLLLMIGMVGDSDRRGLWVMTMML